nr:MFS transporter [Allomuricauda sp.]
MKQSFDTLLYQLLKISNPKELKLVFWSALYFFCLLCSYFILRPLRDEMGILNGAVNMQWLFTGTFVAMLCVVPVFGYLVSKHSTRNVLQYAYTFCIVNILIFYLLFSWLGPSKEIAVAFFIWLSVFNLFVVSLFWSFMADVFQGGSSKRLFGIIASGGSLGALTGPLITNLMAGQLPISVFLLIAAAFMAMALFCIRIILRLHPSRHFNKQNKSSMRVSVRDIFEGVHHIVRSNYLLGIVGFVFLYTAISTVLYFEQAHIVENEILESSARIAYFSRLDLMVNTIAISGQFLLTARVVQLIGLSKMLFGVPVIIGIGLFYLGQQPSLMAIFILMVLHRSGNFMLLRPGREMLFTVTGTSQKYKAKNFIDTAIYRGGDALVGWIFAGLTSMGWGLGIIAQWAAPFAFLWGLLGFRLGKSHQNIEKSITLKKKLYGSNV